MNYTYLGLVALGSILSFYSCDKESDSEVEEEVFVLERFFAVLDGDNQDSLKSYQQGCVEHGIHNKWDDNDIVNVYVFTHNNSNSGYGAQSSGTFKRTGQDGEFAIFQSDNSVKTEIKTGHNILATHNATATYGSGNDKNLHVNFSIPSTQEYNSKTVNAMPMVALNKDYQQNGGQNWQTLQSTIFKFKNLASIIRFDVKPCDCEGKKFLKSVTVTSDKGIAGEGKVHYDGNMNLQPENFAGNGKTITLNCISADTIQGILSYVMVIPPVQDANLTFKINVGSVDDEEGIEYTEYTLGTKNVSFKEASTYKTVAIDLNKY